LEVLLIGLGLKLHQQNLYFVSSFYSWLTPFADAALFTLTAVPFVLALLMFGGNCWTRPATLLWTIWFYWLGLLQFSEIFTLGIHHLAMLFLAICLAWRTTGILVTSTRWWTFQLPRLVIVGLALHVLILMGWGLCNSRALWQMAASRTAQKEDPDVILIVWDTARAASCSVYGHAQPTTPGLERLAARSVTCERAIAPSSWSVPSHATIFTGQHPHELGTSLRAPLPPGPKTLAEVFHERGYATGGFVGNIRLTGRLTGLDRGFSHYSDCSLSFEEVLYCTRAGRNLSTTPWVRSLVGFYSMLGQKSAAQIHESCLSWASMNADRPCFVFVNCFDVHDPYLPPPPLREKWGPRTHDEKLLMAQWVEDTNWKTTLPAPEATRVAVQAYDGCFVGLDAEFESFLTRWKALDRQRELIVIVTSDHGELFSEHDVFGHSYSLYRNAVHVPLIISAPGLPAGARLSPVLGLRDLPATVIDLAGIPGKPLPGTSFLAKLKSPEPEDARSGSLVLAEIDRCPFPNLPPPYPAAHGPVRSLFLKGFHYTRIESDPPQESLYDFIEDPAESRNLIEDPAQSALVQQFRDALKRGTF